MSNEKTATKQKLTREGVLEAALGLADEVGLSGVSMRKVAGRVGVEAMSLYNHVANKEDLIDGIVDRVAARFEVPDPKGHWKDEMRKRALSMRLVLLEHPWAPIPLVSRINSGPAILRHVDCTIGCLINAGFNYDQADNAWNAMDSLIYGFTIKEISFPFQPDEYADAAEEYQPLIPVEKFPYLAGMAQSIMAGEHTGVQSMNYGLEMILDGIEAKLAAQ